MGFLDQLLERRKIKLGEAAVALRDRNAFIEGRRRRREEQRRLELAEPIELRDWVVATARDVSFYQAVDLLVMKICTERISHETLFEAWRLTSPHGIEMVESHWDATWVFQRAMDRLNRTPPPHFGAVVD